MLCSFLLYSKVNQSYMYIHSLLFRYFSHRGCYRVLSRVLCAVLLLLLLSRFSRVQLCATPQTAAHQAPPSLRFSRQEHWSGLPFPYPIHESEVAQSCPTLSDPMDCSLPGFSVHEIFQARVLEWGAIAFSSVLYSRSLLIIYFMYAAKSRRLVKAMVFPVVMYGCESWTVKKAECRRIDAFELWCWRRLLRVPQDCKEIQPAHSEGDQPWDFFGRNDAKAESPVLWPPHAKS